MKFDVAWFVLFSNPDSGSSTGSSGCSAKHLRVPQQSFTGGMYNRRLWQVIQPNSSIESLFFNSTCWLAVMPFSIFIFISNLPSTHFFAFIHLSIISYIFFNYLFSHRSLHPESVSSVSGCFLWIQRNRNWQQNSRVSVSVLRKKMSRNLQRNP